MLLVVLDTNIALDVLLFQEPQAEPLRAARDESLHIRLSGGGSRPALRLCLQGCR